MPPPFSIWILLGLMLVLALSSLMFWAHVIRSTHQRLWISLGDWANRNGFKLHRGKRAALPAPLADITRPPPTACVALAGQRTIFLQLDTPDPSGQSKRWNVVIQEIEAYWPVTALRPSHHERNLADFFRTEHFAALMSSQRFTIHSQDALAARLVAQSMLVALLPKDVGLVLHGRRMLIDFSTRPFDQIELSRVLALANQLTKHLPVLR